MGGVVVLHTFADVGCIPPYAGAGLPALGEWHRTAGRAVLCVRIAAASEGEPEVLRPCIKQTQSNLLGV